MASSMRAYGFIYECSNVHSAVVHSGSKKQYVQFSTNEYYQQYTHTKGSIEDSRMCGNNKIHIVCNKPNSFGHIVCKSGSCASL
jgi:hypothetical protein